MNRAVFFLVMTLSLSPFSATATAQEDDAFKAANRGDYETARKLWSAEAEQGDAVAQFNLGALYEKGLSVEPDMTLALEWYRKASAQGLAAADNALANIYYEGRGGVAINRDRAYALYKKGAAGGDESARHNMETMQIKAESTGGEGSAWWAKPVAWGMAHKEVAAVYLLLLVAAPFVFLRKK